MWPRLFAFVEGTTDTSNACLLRTVGVAVAMAMAMAMAEVRRAQSKGSARHHLRRVKETGGDVVGSRRWYICLQLIIFDVRPGQP